jgi:hypothetical protein
MNDQLINEITLECLMNKQQYAKHIGKSSTVTKESIRKDKRFYKKRIFDLTKKLLNNEKPETMYPDVGSAFDSYARVCIEYFKVLDKSDIIQEDYAGIEDGWLNNLPADPSYNAVEESMLIMRSIKINEPNALEKLVKRTTSKLEKKPLIPIQKDINLKDPTLKNKGISKKNNINNKYEETHEKNNTEKTEKTEKTTDDKKTTEIQVTCN